MPTVNVTANGATVIAAPLASAATALMISGDPQGGTMVFEGSSNGTNYAPFVGFTPQEPGIYHLPVPAGWSVRVQLSGAKAVPALVVGLD
jgi:hypothetical protein